MPDEHNLEETSILDYSNGEVARLAHDLRKSPSDAREYLCAAHGEIVRRVQPIYSLDELQPASRTLRKGAGSCSQRLALLEALSRAAGIATRARAFWIRGQFWYRRFHPLLAFFIPRRVLLVWPEFWIQDAWCGVEEIFGTLDRLAAPEPDAFTNEGETLFDAVARSPVDFCGRTCGFDGGKYDLSRFVVGNAGIFASRDEVFASQRPFHHTVRGRAFEIIFGGRRSFSTES